MTKPTVQRRRLAAKLRNLRAEADVVPERVLEELNWSRSKLSRIENAVSGISVPDVRALCGIYGVQAELTAGLCAMSKQSKGRGWWRAYDDALSEYFSDYLELESEAVSITSFEVDLIPGLCQTEEYARSVIRSWAPDIDDGQVNRRTELRVARQTRIEEGVPFWVVIDEAAIRRICGSREIMATQLKTLIETARMPNVTLQVLPFSAGTHAAMGTPFTKLDFEALYDPVVYIDTLTSALYLEDQEEVARYALAIEHLRAAALDPRQSLSSLKRVRGEIGG